jgi:type IV secretory pathway VirB3-like protein
MVVFAVAVMLVTVAKVSLKRERKFVRILMRCLFGMGESDSLT